MIYDLGYLEMMSACIVSDAGDDRLHLLYGSASRNFVGIAMGCTFRYPEVQWPLFARLISARNQ